MFKKQQKEKETADVELTCSTCGKPVAGKARSDVTRYLFQESRCQCGKPRLVSEEDKTENRQAEEKIETVAALPDCEAPADNGSDNDSKSNSEQKPDQIPAWQAKVLDNLPEQYEVLSLIGEGGMGTVWKVRDKNLDKIFAIKVLRPWLVEDENALRRFEQEADAASHLTHVNMAAVYNFGLGKQGAPYIVMDYLEGENLSKIIEAEGCIDVPRSIDLFIQIAEAVGHAHMKGVIHRDIKPTNIIVERNQEGIEIAKLVDFGIAKILSVDGAATKGHTRTGDVFGSPPYMSPEQCLGNQLDAYSDVYAFGCVMYETLCGKPPFSAENSIKTILKHLETDPQPIGKASVKQAIPYDLEYIVMRCLEKSPIDRYQSIHDLEEDLRRVKQGKPVTRVRKAPILKANKVGDYDVESLYRRKSLAAKYSIVAALLYWLPLCLLIGYSILRGFDAYTQADQVHLRYAHTLKQEAAQKTAKLSKNIAGLVDELNQIAASHIAAKEYTKAIPLLELGAKTCRESNLQNTTLADILRRTGDCYKKLGKPEKAKSFYCSALLIYEGELHRGKMVDQDTPEYKAAQQCAREVLPIFQKEKQPFEAAELKKTWHLN